MTVCQGRNLASMNQKEMEDYRNIGRSEKEYQSSQEGTFELYKGEKTALYPCQNVFSELLTPTRDETRDVSKCQAHKLFKSVPICADIYIYIYIYIYKCL